MRSFRPGDLVVSTAGGLRAWSTHEVVFRFFDVPIGTVGTVIDTHVTDDVLWCRAIFPQGVGWVTGDRVTYVK